VPGVMRVFFGEDFITITKETEETDWALVKPQVFATIMDHYTMGRVILDRAAYDEWTGWSVDARHRTFAAGPSSTSEESSSDDCEVIAMIKELLDSRIRPMVQEDGGDIQFVVSASHHQRRRGRRTIRASSSCVCKARARGARRAR